MNHDIAEILFSETAIVQAIDRLAAEITAAYGDRELTVVSVLKGSCIFASDLIRRIPIPLELAFVAAASYRDGTEAQQLAVHYVPGDDEIAGRTLLLVDDILDTGRTLSALCTELRRRGAADVATCVLLDKPSRRAVDFRATFRGFEIGDTFVVGYGLDYAGRYRNLPYVGALKPEILAARAVPVSG